MTTAAPIDDIQKELRSEGLDSWLLTDFRGQNPIASRVLRLDPDSAGSRRWFYLIPAEGSPMGLVSAVEPDRLGSLPGTRLLYSSRRELTARLKELLKGRRRVAMEYSPLSEVSAISRVDGGTLELVRNAGARVSSSGDLVQAFEAVLSPVQLRTHWEAAGLLHQFVFDAFHLIAKAVSRKRPLSEIEVQQYLMGRFKEHGLTTDHAPTVAVGPHSANPHYEPLPSASTRLRAGDLILIDLWAKLDRPDSVYADITWMGYAGETVPEKYARVFKVVRHARDAAVRLVEKSASGRRKLCGWQVDEAARSILREAGHESRFIHRTGHSIGTEVHGNGANMDNYESRETRHLIPGTLFSIEPGAYLNLFGVRSEIDVYFGDGEAYVTTKPVQTEIVPLLRPGALNPQIECHR